jgi:hypothetical protein
MHYGIFSLTTGASNNLFSSISILKKKKKIRNINLEIRQFSCEVTASANILKKVWYIHCCSGVLDILKVALP